MRTSTQLVVATTVRIGVHFLRALPVFAVDRISSHTTTAAKTTAMLCITIYPAGVARNSLTDSTCLLLIRATAATAAAVITFTAALLATAGHAAVFANGGGISDVCRSTFSSHQREYGANDG